jgi:hypothetical protein
LSPAGLGPSAATQFNAIALAGIGLALGVSAAFLVTRGERLTILPVLALVAGVLMFAWIALGLWNPIGPGVLDYRSWGLTTMGPAVGALGFWVASGTWSSRARVGSSLNCTTWPSCARPYPAASWHSSGVLNPSRFRGREPSLAAIASQSI